MIDPPDRPTGVRSDMTFRDRAFHGGLALMGGAALVGSFAVRGWVRGALTVLAVLLLLIPVLGSVSTVVIRTLAGAGACLTRERPRPRHWAGLLAVATAFGSLLGAGAPGVGPADLVIGPALVVAAAAMARGPVASRMRRRGAVAVAWAGVAAASVGAALLFA